MQKPLGVGKEAPALQLLRLLREYAKRHVLFMGVAVTPLLPNVGLRRTSLVWAQYLKKIYVIENETILINFRFWGYF